MAAEVVAIIDERVRANEQMTPEFIERRAMWWRRLRDARIAATDDPREKLAAAEEHLNRCEAFRSGVLHHRLEASRVGAIWTGYGVAEAERRIAELTASR